MTAFGYRVAVIPLHERKEYISAQMAASSRRTTSYDVHEGTPTELTVIRVPLNLPIYRMANGRTQTQQLAYLAQKPDLPVTYFQVGEENETAQQVQHDILRIYAREGNDSLTPIIEELARTKQTEPLLITAAGVVVNGNRRLAAMRELYTERTADFPSFATVECSVLPPLSAQQVDDVEIRLQMRPETKLPYGWIDECLKIQKQLDYGRSEDDIARLMRKGVGTIRKALSAQKYAEIYLTDWKKTPRDYRLVEAGEQFFNDLVGKLRGKTGDLLEANMRVAWILFDNRTTLGSRIYEFNKVIGEKAAEVLSGLAERLDLDEQTEDQESETTEDLDVDLGDLVGAPASPYETLIRVMDDESRRSEVADELRAVCQTIIDAGRTARQGNSALGAVRDAHTRLTEVDLTGASPRTYDGIDRQLDEVISKATALKESLQTYRAGNVT